MQRQFEKSFKSPSLPKVIWLVSYPRSGNTFLRNVLYEVYGLASATYHLEEHGPDEHWDTFPVVKTHLLPHQLPMGSGRKVVYLIRDGRDAVVSLAHHRCDVIAPGTDFEKNLQEAVYAAEGSHFGGWSAHVESWIPRADLIIRFEDLTVDPLGQCERLRALFELPAPRGNSAPGFETLKSGRPEYGSGKHLGKDMADKWFRRGKINGWKDELASDMHDLFWHLHGECMEVVGYGYDGNRATGFEYLGACFRRKAGLERSPDTVPVNVLIEAGKLDEPFVDGIKRYVSELLRVLERWPQPSLKIKAFVRGNVLSLNEALSLDGSQHPPVRKGWVSVMKQVAKILLPRPVYHVLARQFPLHTLHTKPRAEGLQSHHAMGSGDILHLTLPQHHEPFGSWTGHVVATIHDMTHVTHAETHDANNVRLAEDGMQWLAEKDAVFIAVSGSTRADLPAIMPDANACTVAEGVDRRRFYPIRNAHLLAWVRDHYQLPDKKFLLSVSTLEPRKNLAMVIEAYAALPNNIREEFHLVLAGRKGWKWKGYHIPTPCRGQVHFTGFVREDHLPALYTLAHGFCYVSLYEGFGLPVLEAMACGCPVIASGNSSLPEVVGSAGLLVDPFDKAQISEAMYRLCTAKALREELAYAGQRQSWKYTWSRCAEGTLSAYFAAADETNRSGQKRRRTSSPSAG